jgi:serpin B
MAIVISALLVFPRLLAQNPASAAAVSEVASANSQFALALYQNINADKTSNGQNIFFSPYSISTALAMTYVGSRNNTQKQMASVLHFQMPGAELEAGYSSLLAQTKATPAKHYKLEVANALWVQEGVQFEPAFTSAISKYFDGGFNALDFVHEPDASVLKINKWVEGKTADKIRNLLHEGDINSLTRLILTNAIYFKGDWALKFKKENTQIAPFTVHPGKTVNVPMMEQEDRFPFVQNDEMKMIELPYAGNDLSMNLILPAIDAEKFGATLSLEKLNELRRRMSPQEVHLFLPRFKFETRYYLEQGLSAMGMPDAFDGRKADFSGMTGRTDFHISRAIHKAMIDVNEEGSEAAAATAMEMMAMGIPPPPAIFCADHPFIFTILHKPTDSILFMGRVSNPPAAASAGPAHANRLCATPPNASGHSGSTLPPLGYPNASGHSGSTLPPSGYPSVTIISSGDYETLRRPVKKGQMVPDYNVEGGLKPLSLAMPPVPPAPPGSIVLIKIVVDENGNVTPDRILNDTSGAGQQVEQAARSWKFKPPTAKGEPVKTPIVVKVAF